MLFGDARETMEKLNTGLRNFNFLKGESMASKDTHLTKDPNQLISTGAFPASEKIFVSGNLHPHIKVPMRKINLTNGEQQIGYDTSGPYTDVNSNIDIHNGLHTPRKDWVLGEKRDGESYEGRVSRPEDTDTAPKGPLLLRVYDVPLRAKSGMNVLYPTSLRARVLLLRKWSL